MPAIRTRLKSVVTDESNSDPLAREVRMGWVRDAASDIELANASMTGAARPNETIVHEGDLATSFFNISRGTVRLYNLLPDGRRQIIAFAGPGDFIGLTIHNRYEFTMDSVDAVEYRQFSRGRLRALAVRSSLTDQHMLDLATTELRSARAQILLLGRKSARERLASFLIARGNLCSEAGGSASYFLLPMCRQDIADYLGLTVETICRILAKFRVEGVTDVSSRSRVFIRDRLALIQIAEGHRQDADFPPSGWLARSDDRQFSRVFPAAAGARAMDRD